MSNGKLLNISKSLTQTNLSMLISFLSSKEEIEFPFTHLMTCFSAVSHCLILDL